MAIVVPAYSNSCSFKDCPNNGWNCYNFKPPIKFFRYPINDRRRCLEWISVAKRDDLLMLKDSQLQNRRVCSFHFYPEQVLLTGRLVHDAVPHSFELDQNPHVQEPGSIEIQCKTEDDLLHLDGNLLTGVIPVSGLQINIDDEKVILAKGPRSVEEDTGESQFESLDSSQDKSSSYGVNKNDSECAITPRKQNVGKETLHAFNTRKISVRPISALEKKPLGADVALEVLEHSSESKPAKICSNTGETQSVENLKVIKSLKRTAAVPSQNFRSSIVKTYAGFGSKRGEKYPASNNEKDCGKLLETGTSEVDPLLILNEESNKQLEYLPKLPVFVKFNRQEYNNLESSEFLTRKTKKSRTEKCQGSSSHSTHLETVNVSPCIKEESGRQNGVSLTPLEAAPITVTVLPLRLQAKDWGHFPRLTPQINIANIQPVSYCIVCTKRGELSATSWECERCLVPLHLPECFKKFHTEYHY